MFGLITSYGWIKVQLDQHLSIRLNPVVTCVRASCEDAYVCVRELSDGDDLLKCGVLI